MTGLLASVTNLAEARLMVTAGADFIDLKDPAAGALGALPVHRVTNIVEQLNRVRPVSATIGDLPLAADDVVPAVRAALAAGVDYVKIGFFPNGDPAAVLTALEPLIAGGGRLIAVLFADLNPNANLIPSLAAAGFAGVMLDTADKARGSLLQLARPDYLGDFVATARAAGLLCGLAGSLRAEDIDPLGELEPDFLGFRTALCGGQRTASIDAEAAGRLVARLKSLHRALQSRCSTN